MLSFTKTYQQFLTGNWEQEQEAAGAPPFGETNGVSVIQFSLLGYWGIIQFTCGRLYGFMGLVTEVFVKLYLMGRTQ